ncbi:acetyl-CoA acetyltransferase [Amycolatopsis pigmentata]|uniref:Acetyl-CoA acetyltransferase n=1 Tax=Amycolatopsis pigmentata TaxID=450801 RepID=A0ABW5G6L3_9PSEU
MSDRRVFILGGHQTDFQLKWPADDLFGMLEASILGALRDAEVETSAVDSIHIANFGAEIFSGQALLGGMAVSVHPDFAGLPTVRHESACASGGVAILQAMAEIEAGRSEVVVVTGVEIMRNVPGREAAERMRAGTWLGREVVDESLPVTRLFGKMADEYQRRYGIDHAHLGRIAEKNLTNARRNPKAQTRSWDLDAVSFGEDDETNPVVSGLLRKQDCGRITDGGAAVVLASASFTERHLARRSISMAGVPVIGGWGHSTAPLLLEDKFRASQDDRYVFPFVRSAITSAYRRAGVDGPRDLDVIETHDCYSITEYLALDHFGITAPGESWVAVEKGETDFDGPLPVNPSGGLIGLGHPLGATGVRMLLDAARQVSGTAGDYQVEGAARAGTLNLGGSATSAVSFVVERAG